MLDPPQGGATQQILELPQLCDSKLGHPSKMQHHNVPPGLQLITELQRPQVTPQLLRSDRTTEHHGFEGLRHNGGQGQGIRSHLRWKW